MHINEFTHLCAFFYLCQVLYFQIEDTADNNEAFVGLEKPTMKAR